MKHPTLFATALLVAAPLLAADSPAVRESTDTGGWSSLFDGASLAGWRSLKSAAPGAGWKVEDGAIVLRGKAGDLVSKEAFGDFELSLEWKVAAESNSGVIYRVGLEEAQTFFTGPEYQVLDNEKAEDNKKPNHLAASLYDLAAPTKATTKPVGEWNQARIVVRGWHIEHWLNGEKVVDVDLGSPAGKELIRQSKFADWSKFASLARGHIALQDHGHFVAFRAIKIRALP